MTDDSIPVDFSLLWEWGVDKTLPSPTRHYVYIRWTGEEVRGNEYPTDLWRTADRTDDSIPVEIRKE